MSRNFTLSAEVPRDKKKESFKIAVLGDAGVGKSTLTCRVLKHWIELSNNPRRKRKEKKDRFCVFGRDLNVHLRNTSSSNILKGLEQCDVFVLVYSLVDDESFKSVCVAREHILQTVGGDARLVFVANKTDIGGSSDSMARYSRHFHIIGRWKHSHLEISAETDPSTLDVLEAILTNTLIRSSDLGRTERSVNKCSGRQKEAVRSSAITDDKTKISKRRNGLDFTSFCSL